MQCIVHDQSGSLEIRCETGEDRGNTEELKCVINFFPTEEIIIGSVV